MFRSVGFHEQLLQNRPNRDLSSFDELLFNKLINSLKHNTNRYLPMQKLEKMCPSNTSAFICPVIVPI